MCTGGSVGKIINPVSALPSGPLQVIADPAGAARDKVSSALTSNPQVKAIINPADGLATSSDPLKKSQSNLKTALGS